MSRPLLASALVLGLAASAAAQFDHLQCFKVKADPKVKGIVDLTAFQAEVPSLSGCKITGPTLFCTPVAKTVVQAEPPPAGGSPGPEASDFLCYKARCKGEAGDLQVTDQFATFSLRLRKSFLLCTPAQKGGPATTTTTMLPPCSGSSAPTCAGTCPAGQGCATLSFGVIPPGCGCASLPVCGMDPVSGTCGGNCPGACVGCFVAQPGGGVPAGLCVCGCL